LQIWGPGSLDSPRQFTECLKILEIGCFFNGPNRSVSAATGVVCEGMNANITKGINPTRHIKISPYGLRGV